MLKNAVSGGRPERDRRSVCRGSACFDFIAPMRQNVLLQRDAVVQRAVKGETDGGRFLSTSIIVEHRFAIALQ